MLMSFFREIFEFFDPVQLSPLPNTTQEFWNETLVASACKVTARLTVLENMWIVEI
jgi:hypothetical protein